MPALPVLAKTWIVTQHYDASNARHQFITRHCLTSAGTPALSVIATDMAHTIASRMMLMLSNEITMGNTDVLPLDGTSSTTTFTTADAGTIGSDAAGQALPYSSCLLTTWQTGQRGKSKRGRTYWPGVRSDRVIHPESNLVNPSDVANITTFGNDIIADLSANGLELSVLSIKHGFTTLVSNARGSATVAVQRRRYERVARH
jgi:hypothetical protein